LSSQPQWDRDTGLNAKWIGARYLAFKLASQGQIDEARQVVAWFEKEKTGQGGAQESSEKIHLSIGQGMALKRGIEEAKAYIKEQCRGLMRYDFAADLWAVARVLLMFGEYKKAWELVQTDTFRHPGRDKTWIDLAGQFYAHLPPGEFAARLSALDQAKSLTLCLGVCPSLPGGRD
jgi:hypothetical protein